MKKFTKIFAYTTILAATFTLTACDVVSVRPAHDHHDHGYGPPPHAPAHGYRHKHHNHDLVYDAHLGVYIVVGLADYYFDNGNYYRYEHDTWHYSDRLDGKWRKTDRRKLPSGLSKRNNKHYGNKGRDRDDNNRRRGHNNHDDDDD